MKAQVYVFSNSVLCVGKLHEYPQANIEWESRLSCFKSTPQYKELDGLDGEPLEFEWRKFPGHTTLQTREIQKLMGGWDCTPEEIPGRIILMSLFNDIIR